MSEELTKELLLRTNDSGALEVEVPGWPKIWVKSWTGHERQKFLTFLKAAQERPDTDRISDATLHAYICCLGICNAQGVRLFADGDESLLLGKSATALEAVADKILEHNGVTKASREAARANFRVTPNESSGTVSLAG